ncbi:hypothetical protein PHLCEN_2v6932 [Hermanssonia centrifuga]|uniref:Uncharacterized protein n=1 Tax=Hermanssonia centrifuga TaxID=98765 RepID=A0A2R6NXZ0_9APHY|nr:hypothetical protein PHLCEN_2v6932 [Hermanssonia centrifuga]
MLATWAVIVLMKRRAKRRAQRIYAQVTAYDPPSVQEHSFANPEWEKPARGPDVESYYKAPELGYEYKPTYIPPVYKPAVLESARNSFEVIPPAIPAPPTVQGHLYPPPVTS